MDDQVFRRVKAVELREHKHARVAVVGRVESCANDKLHLDCGEGKLQASANTPDLQLGELKQGDYVEVRGEPISDNFLIMSDFNRVPADFDLALYNRTLGLLAAKMNSYA